MSEAGAIDECLPLHSLLLPVHLSPFTFICPFRLPRFPCASSASRSVPRAQSVRRTRPTAWSAPSPAPYGRSPSPVPYGPAPWGCRETRWQTPVPMAGRIRRLLMYAGSHYPLWRAEWGREDIGPGAFGENLTVEGMTEDETCIGDVLEIGGGPIPGLPSAAALCNPRPKAPGPQHDRPGARERPQRLVSPGA